MGIPPSVAGTGPGIICSEKVHIPTPPAMYV